MLNNTIAGGWLLLLGILSIAVSAGLIILVLNLIKKISAQLVESRDNALKIGLFDKRLAIYKALQLLKIETRTMLTFIKDSPIEKRLLVVCYDRINTWKNEFGAGLTSAQFLFDEDIAFSISQIDMLLIKLTSPLESYPAINEDITIIKIEETIEKIKINIENIAETLKTSGVVNKMQPYLTITCSV